MTKIDVGTIEGFNEMSVEDKLTALLNYEFETPAPDSKAVDSGETEKLKAQLNKANAEAADYKRKLREKMSEAEQKEAERVEAETRMREELNTLKRERTSSGYAANLVGIGYDSDTAKKIGEMLPDNIPDEFFVAHKAFAEQLKKNVESELLKKQPGLTNGAAPSSNNFEDQVTAELRRYAGLTK